MTDLLEETKEEVKTGEPGDHDRFKHYVFKDALDTAILNGGGPIRAVCGKLWDRPTLDYDRFPLCPECKEFYDAAQDA